MAVRGSADLALQKKARAQRWVAVSELPRFPRYYITFHIDSFDCSSQMHANKAFREALATGSYVLVGYHTTRSLASLFIYTHAP